MKPNIAFMFPGQGSQFVGMGQDLIDNPLAKEIFKTADQSLNFSLSNIMFEGSEEELKQTQNTQVAILTHSIALWTLLKSSISIKDYNVVGHSLGEYSAYVASNRISFTHTLSLVRHRGVLMSEVSSAEYGMAAVLKISKEDLESILLTYADNKVFIANNNCPSQIVISGLKSHIDIITPYLVEKGARIVLLPVSGAFHSPYMEPAAIKFRSIIEPIEFLNSNIPLYSNVDALPILYGQEHVSLVTQIYSGVLFLESIQNMITNGVSIFIEVGPGKVLQGLVKKINSDVQVFGVQNINDIEIIKEIL